MTAEQRKEPSRPLISVLTLSISMMNDNISRCHLRLFFPSLSISSDQSCDQQSCSEKLIFFRRKSLDRCLLEHTLTFCFLNSKVGTLELLINSSDIFGRHF